MIFNSVHRISRHIQPIVRAEVKQIEAHLGIQLPLGYTEFITQFGIGLYCGFFRIYSPEQIKQQYFDQRKLWDRQYFIDNLGIRHWFFEGSEDILSETELQESFVIGDSMDGDNLVFYPPHPDKIYILPRHLTAITWVKADLSDLHWWDTPTPRVLTFMPWSQISLNFYSEQFALDNRGLLDQFEARWGSDALIVDYESSDAWSWTLGFFLIPIGGHVQVTQDEGVTRTFVDENGNMVTTEGNGIRELDIQIDCDEESIEDVEKFMAYLSAQGLLIVAPET
jgi:hypothetical protein